MKIEMNNIVSQIKALDTYVNAMKKIEDRESKRQDLDNLLYHINILKTWAGITLDEINEPNIQHDNNLFVCEMCHELKELYSDNLCKKCYDELPY